MRCRMDPPPDMAPSAKGDLVKTPLAHLFVFMAERRLQGSLVLHGDDGSTSTVFWVGGAPAKVQTTYPGTHLGRVLLQLGYVDDEVLQRSETERSQTGGLHGQILLAMGAIDEAKLVAGLREQMVRRLLRIFEKAGDLTTFAFYAGVNLLSDYGGPEATPIDPYKVMWEGMHVRPNDASIDPTLSRLGNAAVGLSANVDFRRYGFGPPELKVLELLKVRPMSLAQVLELNVMPIRQLKLLMYALLITKGIGVAPARPSTPPREAPDSSPRPQVGSSPDSPPPSTRQGVPMARVKLKSTKVPASTVNAARRPADPPPSPAPTQEREAIVARASEIEGEDFFQVLGISRKDPPDVARAAYFALAKKWHPDRLPNELADVRDDAARVFARISEAFQTLSDADKRAHYVELLDKGSTEADEQAKVQRIIEATIEFQKAEVFLRKREIDKALKSAKKAYEGDPEQAPHVALYAWALANQPEAQASKRFEESFELLEQAIKMQENYEQAYFYRAMLLKQQGKMKAALRDFRRVADMNPRNIDAIREVRLAEMRGETKNEPAPSNPERTRTRPGASSQAPEQPINWTKDSVGDIFGKLFKKK